MTKFEQVGVNYQYNARSKYEANSSFMRSCHCCCERGMRIDCDRCAIAHTHSMVMATFADSENNNGNEPKLVVFSK